jgi:hypothetical protein
MKLNQPAQANIKQHLGVVARMHAHRHVDAGSDIHMHVAIRVRSALRELGLQRVPRVALALRVAQMRLNASQFGFQFCAQQTIEFRDF